MELYIRFISTLAFGLIGLGAVLKVLLETLFNDWDAFNDISERVMISCSGKGGQVEHIRAEDILLEAEKRNTPELSTRVVDWRRRQMKELDEVENRLDKVRARISIPDTEIIPS
jgi:hypothetical protein